LFCGGRPYHPLVPSTSCYDLLPPLHYFETTPRSFYRHREPRRRSKGLSTVVSCLQATLPAPIVPTALHLSLRFEWTLPGHFIVTPSQAAETTVSRSWLCARGLFSHYSPPPRLTTFPPARSLPLLPALQSYSHWWKLASKRWSHDRRFLPEDLFSHRRLSSPLPPPTPFPRLRLSSPGQSSFIPCPRAEATVLRPLFRALTLLLVPHRSIPSTPKTRLSQTHPSSHGAIASGRRL
jgi:hypothetical protein